MIHVLDANGRSRLATPPPTRPDSIWSKTYRWAGRKCALTPPAGYLPDAATKTVTVSNQEVSTVYFQLTKRDTTPPVLSLPSDITAEATSPNGAAVTYTVSATDDVDGAVTPTCTPASGSTFGLGLTTVTCSATDQAGQYRQR